MSSYSASRATPCLPGRLIEMLTDPRACLAWSPVPLELEDSSTPRLQAGTRARVRGALCGQSVGFSIAVECSDDDRFALRAEGPFAVDVEYRLMPDEIRVSVATSEPRGLAGRCLKAAGDALLAGGLLNEALRRLERHAELVV